MIAVLMTLLFIDMVSAPVISHSMIELPTATHWVWESGATREDKMEVDVTRGGGIYFRRYAVDRLSEERLRDQIRGAVAAGAEKKVYLNADGHTAVADVSVAIDAARHAGISKIVILTEAHRPRKTPSR